MTMFLPVFGRPDFLISGPVPPSKFPRQVDQISIDRITTRETHPKWV